ncbi:DUF4169 family protein [Rhodobacteraceae bacterium 2376]|uniref:DUF4169 family protein n=1 Tax=Rhabdonatronobacter sediminivivens TaxID=2743469 RepID=A0A7Z0KX64_9RHOB|nr:DUF4169 family protein [Rhabdonatronobacter sediminivivens]NYS24592.1 DUF4169 family protein [Rhabdonatronobacter sediminivivens]
MSRIINLRTARKQAARDRARQEGDENAARHGRSRAERKLGAALQEKARTQLDGHQRDPDPKT